MASLVFAKYTVYTSKNNLFFKIIVIFYFFPNMKVIIILVVLNVNYISFPPKTDTCCSPPCSIQGMLLQGLRGTTAI